MLAFQTFHPAAIGPFVLVILGLVVLGFCLWLLLKYIPMEPPIPAIIIAVVVILAVLWLLKSFGML